jgi:hypothetical protein
MQRGFNVHPSLPNFRLLSEPHWLRYFAPRRSVVIPIIFRDNLDQKKRDHIEASFSCRRIERRLPDFIPCIGSRSRSRVTILNFLGFTSITYPCSNIQDCLFCIVPRSDVCSLLQLDLSSMPMAPFRYFLVIYLFYFLPRTT